MNRDVMTKVKSLVANVLQQESKSRWSQQRQAVRHEARHQSKMAEAAGSHEDHAEDEELERVLQSILNHPDNQDLEPGVVQLIIDQARATVLMKRLLHHTILHWKS